MTDGRPTDIVIIGGGIAGLAAAYELHLRGVPFLLLEAANRPGGVILTDRVDGFTIDAGPDALLTQKPAAIALCRELGLGDRLVSTLLPRAAYIVRGGRLHPLPEASVLGIPTRIAPLVTTRLFSIGGKARMAAEIVVPRRPASLRDESVGSFMRRRFGNEAVTYLAEPLLAGIHAGRVDRLSMAALFPRLWDAEAQHGSLIRAFRRMARSAGNHGDGVFRSLPGGLDEMVSALVNALPAGSIRCGAAARVLEGTRPYTVGLASGEILQTSSVILATPAFVTADLLETVDARLAARCREVPYASVAIVALAYPRDRVAHPLRGSGFVVPRPERKAMLASTWISSKWPHRAPAGHVLLRAFLGGAGDPGMVDRDDDDLLKVTEAELRELLGTSGAPALRKVYRWRRASAQHEIGHLDRIAEIDRRLETLPGLYLTGSGFRGTGIPDCIADGRAVAAKAAIDTQDEER